MGNDLDKLEKVFHSLAIEPALTSSDENLCFMMSCAAADLVGRGGVWWVGDDGMQSARRRCACGAQG
jgi:hypothetical protein